MDAHKYVQYFSAFKCEAGLIASSCIKTTEGLWYLHQPVVVLNLDTALSEIGQAVLSALAASQAECLEPPSQVALDDTLALLFKAVGVQTFEQFQESILHCCVGRDAEGIEITPTHIGGPHDIRFLLEDRILLEANISPENVGTAFLQGFAASTSIYQ